jgi:hypothetical protein
MGSTTVSTYTETALPYTSLPGTVFANWDDLYPPTGGGVWYYHDVARGRFVIEWDSVPLYRAQTNYQKFEIFLYDSTHSVNGIGTAEVMYQIISDPSSCTVGEQAPTTSVFIQCLFDNAYHRGTAPIGPNRAIRFGPPGDAVEEPVAGARLPKALGLAVSPNPFRSVAGINWQLPSAGRVRLTVYDVTGRAVRTLVNDLVQPGSYTSSWDGCDDAGRLLANGMYLYRIETKAGRVTTKAVMLR